MTSLNANVPDVGSNSTDEHRFPWKWRLTDLDRVKKNGLTVFSCFSCGGGSSMGYKLAGYDVIGCCEIDPRVMAVYQKNNHLPFGVVRSEKGRPVDPTSAVKTAEYLKHMRSTDKSIRDIKKRLYGKESNYNDIIYRDCDVAQTLTANWQNIRAFDKAWMSEQDHVNISTFPQDYDFLDQSTQYICGMSVPPVMMAQVAAQIYEQWFKGDTK